MKKLFVILFALLGMSVVEAAHEEKVQALVSQTEPPSGVVLEIATRQKNALDWALPEAQRLISMLRARFPDLPIAVVTHGNEQFALMKSQQQAKPKVHSLVQQLQAESNTELHVCGTLAEMKKVTPEEFPDYVDVAAEGPAQIKDYESLGYVRIRIRQHK